jgi:hypothetical protein
MNKLDGPITPDDEKKLGNLAGIIGTCVDSTLEVMASMATIINMRNKTDVVANMIT